MDGRLVLVTAVSFHVDDSTAALCLLGEFSHVWSCHLMVDCKTGS